MKNKLKRLQLTLRNFNKKGIIFGAIFALTFHGLSVLTPKTGSYAETGDEIITSANADVVTPLAGNSPVFVASPSDETKYSVTLSSWNLEDDDYHYLETDEAYELGRDYTVRVVFSVNPGYTFDENTIFTINSGETSSYGTTMLRQRTFFNTPEGEAETLYEIIYDLNGATASGEDSIVQHSVSFGLDLSYDNLITELGVEVPAGKVLNYITVNEAPYNIGDGYFLSTDTVIKYFWRDDTATEYNITFDANGGTVIDFAAPPAIPAGQAFAINAPNESEILPPEGQEFDAFEVNGERTEAGSLIFINQDTSVRILWKSTTPTTPDDTDDITDNTTPQADESTTGTEDSEGDTTVPNTGAYVKDGKSALPTAVATAIAVVMLAGVSLLLSKKR